MNKGVFLERDGVINEVLSERVKYVNSAKDVFLLAGAAKAIKILNDQTYKVFIVTNQGDIGLGLMSERSLGEIHSRLLTLLREEAGAEIDDIAFCPSKPHEESDCRKPKPAMILELAKKHQIDLQSSYTIGDMRDDIMAGNEAGTRTILIIEKDEVIPVIEEAYAAISLKDAVKQIIELDNM
jgi:D-glycero-D-manno-heptose 1,7-bisphosphate phosphatase